jgi:hypothetical protein
VTLRDGSKKEIMRLRDIFFGGVARSIELGNNAISECKLELSAREVRVE